MKQHAALKWRSWSDVMALPLEQRIGPAPPRLVDYLTLDNRMNGYPQRPRPAQLDPSFLADVRAAFTELPDAVKRRAADKLIGIFLVEELGGTGFTERLFDSPTPRGFIMLDAAILGARKANAWATWKERSPFRPAPGYELQASIAAPDSDTRRNAIQYILLHELGHVLAIGENMHPPWTTPPSQLGPTAHYTFFNLSWTVDARADTYRAYTDGGPQLPRRSDVAYYFGARLDAADMVPVYRNLQGTNFPTLYAATSPADDFAEAFANYVHVVLMGRPFSIDVTAPKGGLSYGPCWQESRCAQKRRLLEEFLGD